MNALMEKVGVTPKRIVYLLIADLLYALSLNLFYVPHDIAAGGLAGIATAVNSLMPVPIGVMMFLLNLPICLWGIKVKGFRFVALSMVAMGIYSTFVDLLSFLPSLTEDRLVAVICGGIIYGIAASCTVKAQISAGGTDLLAKLIITKFKTMSLGSLYMCIDGCVVVFAIFVYGNIEAGIYAILAIAICSLVTDKLNSGFNKADVFYIFANENIGLISKTIMEDMGRGVTALNGTGMYLNTDRQILFVVVKPNEVPKLKEIVREYDPSAFIVLASASEIIGKGFEGTNLTESLADNKPKKNRKGINKM